MSDQLKSYVRTYWPLIVGTVAGLIAAALAKYVGIEIDSNLAFGVTSVVMVGVVYAGGRWLETRKSSFARAVGRFLLSLGLDTGQPTYPSPPAVRLRGTATSGEKLPPDYL